MQSRLDHSELTCRANVKRKPRADLISQMKACRDLERGKSLHLKAIEAGCHTNIHVATALISMYSRCGSMTDARDIFRKMSRRDVVLWNGLILGYVENGENVVALEMFKLIDCLPNRITFVAAIKACIGLKTDKKVDKEDCLLKGLAVHKEAKELGFESDLYVGSTLVDMYSKFGSMQHAQSVFDQMAHRNVVSWTALILGYTENGESHVALEVFRSMDCDPNSVTFVAVLKACMGLVNEKRLNLEGCLQIGLSIHRKARQHGFENDTYVASTLVNMYSKLGDMVRAQSVFDGMTIKNVVSWTSLILGYIDNSESLVALETFKRMDCEPNHVSYIAALRACAALASEKKLDKESCLAEGQKVHGEAKAFGVDKDVHVASTLVDMYSKCGEMARAREAFETMAHRDVATWTALILGYVENGEHKVALELFRVMDCSPNRVTFVAALKACIGLAKEDKTDKLSCSQLGETIHKQATEAGYDKDVFVASTLVEMYSGCFNMPRAQEIFDEMVERDVVSWTTLLVGYQENGESSTALHVFNNMDCMPDRLCFVAALKACGDLGALEAGRRIHDQVCERKLDEDATVATCLVEFYGRCGDMVSAEKVFSKIHSPDIIAWTALLGGHSLLGHTSQVFKLVKRMQEAGVQMDGVTMLLILSTCSHAGLVEEGQSFFQSMSRYGISPKMEHYTCMVDLLGRVNRLPEALSLIRSMPFEATGVVWRSLLGACKKWSNLEIGEVAFHALVMQNDRDHLAAAYILMRNIYEDLGINIDLPKCK